MKTIFQLLFLFTTLLSSAQNHALLAHFNVFESNGEVVLSWQIVQGSTCNGIGIYRAANQSEFIEIGDIPGICGVSNDPVGYKFVDTNPEKNQVNYYRLDLGGYGFSQIVDIEIIVEPRVDLQFFPNPVSSSSKLYFENKNNQTHQLFIYNAVGVLSKSLETNSDYFTISANEFSKGNYFFKLITHSKALVSQGKFIIP